MHVLQSLFYLTIVLHVSGIIITHLQEHKITVTTASGNRYTVIYRVTFLRNKAQVNKTHYFSWPQTPCLRQQPYENKNRPTRHPHIQISSNSSTIATDNNTGMYIIHYSIEHIAFSAEYILSTTKVILI